MNKLRQGLKRAAAATLGLLLCAVCLIRPAGAVITRNIPVTSGEPCSLTLNFKDPGVTFHLYRVASVSADVRYTLLPTLSGDRNFPNIKDFNSFTKASQWSDLASTLRPYLERYYTPARTVTTDRNGTALFDGLPVGLYLVTGEPYTVTKANGEVWDCQPSTYFVCLPYWTDQNGRGEDWVYDLVVNGSKKEELPHETVSRRVIKIWSSGVRREPVTVELLRNGRVVETVELSERNDWRYEWTNLEPGCRWEVLERSGSYRVTISQTGGTYRIVNSSLLPPQPDGDKDPPGTVSPPSGTTTTPPKTSTTTPPQTTITTPPPQPDISLDDPDVPLDQTPDLDPDHDPDELELDDEDVPLARLPQTGQLWWPVPLLALAGMCLFLFGWGRHRRGEPDGE